MLRWSKKNYANAVALIFIGIAIISIGLTINTLPKVIISNSNEIETIKELGFDKAMSMYLQDDFNSLPMQEQKVKVQKMYFYTCDEVYNFCKTQKDWTDLTGCQYCGKKITSG